jgi:putative inorganic carbon (HCO3(-)) transporter
MALGLALAIGATLYRRWALPLIPIALLFALALNNVTGGPPVSELKGASSLPEGFAGRQEIWIFAIGMILRSPLVGIGLGAYPQVAATQLSGILTGPALSHAHNIFLQVALDTGLIGLAAFIGLLVIAIRLLWRAYRMNFERHLAIGMLSALVVILAHGMIDSATWGAKPSVLLWMLLGLAVALGDKFVPQRVT